ncbi:MAG: hypothetical protein R3C39_02970 [Dehalococcoidia bacterium]
MRRAGVLALLVALLVLGSFAYWWADGRPGTPSDFRGRVADAGLDVAWANSGPRGGSGSVETACGPVAVTVNDLDGELWVEWPGRHEPLTETSVRALLSCASP